MSDGEQGPAGPAEGGRSRGKVRRQQASDRALDIAGPGDGAQARALVAAEPADRIYPVLPLRGLAVFPGTRVPLQVGRQGSLQAVAAAVAGDRRIFFAGQRDPKCDTPTGDDLFTIGTLAVLREVRAEEAGTVRIVAEGLCRARAVGYQIAPGDDPARACLLTAAELLLDAPEPAAAAQVAEVARAVLRRFERLRRLAGPDRVGGDQPLPPADEPGRLCDAVASRVLSTAADRQQVLEALSVRDRLAVLHRILVRETEATEVERDVATRVRHQMERAQREYYLREQLKAIQKELGEGAGTGGGAEAEPWRAALAKAELPAPVRERVTRELERLDRMPPLSAEAVVVRTYLEWIGALPWAERAEEHLDLAEAERILDEDHHGLARVKERILEFLALRRLRAALPGSGGALHAPILCLVGPPGTGKTSLARSVARALGRPFVRISLGGVRDEAEIRGHRRTYVGALPGRLIHGLRQAGKRNPVILLDEIDKMSADYRGDPAAALLEVLDPEQNAAFTDHYLELPFDLSEVVFIATANSVHPLARPLHDRLEVIALQGYTDEEKLAIARRFLLPRQIAECALPLGALSISDGAIAAVIDRYTREAGVRGLERELGTICRRVARRIAAADQPTAVVTARNVATYLGRPHVFRQSALGSDEVGVAMGLGWTEAGGDVLGIEVSVLPGNGRLQLTGKLGEVMRESAAAALSCVRARAGAYGLPADFYGRCELHVHAPEGAVPKEGPSAGVTLAAAMVSALTGCPIRADVAMTGEVTLRGRVLPVGGIKEKVLAAKRAGLRRVVLPAENRGDWDEIGEAATRGLTARFVRTVDEVFAHVLAGGVPSPEQTRTAMPALLLAGLSGDGAVAAGQAASAAPPD